MKITLLVTLHFGLVFNHRRRCRENPHNNSMTSCNQQATAEEAKGCS